MRKNKAFLGILTAILLTGCAMENGTEDISETVSETTRTTETATVTTAETTAETVTETEIETTAETEESIAEYKLKAIVYPEETKTDITAEKVKIEEELFNPNGVNVCDFSAEYPVFSGGDETVMRKINADIKAYMESRLEEAREYAENDTAVIDPDNEEDFIAADIRVYGALETQEISIGSSAWNEKTENFYTVCGNVLSVRFTDYVYGAGAAHGMYGNVILNYDLRTGESIDFNNYLSDAKGLWQKFFTESLIFYYKNELGYDEEDAEAYANFELIEAEEKDFYRDSEEDGYFQKDNVVTGNGCVGIYLAPYEMGSFASGVRIIEIPIDEVLPYLTDEGKALFEGAASARYENLSA